MAHASSVLSGLARVVVEGLRQTCVAPVWVNPVGRVVVTDAAVAWRLSVLSNHWRTSTVAPGATAAAEDQEVPPSVE